MDLPPSGWYPDPYGVPGLLRWWDGSVWTQHTHQDGANGTANGAEPDVTAQQPAAQQPPMPQTTVQPTTVQPTTVQPTTVQPAADQAPPTVPQAAVQPAAPQPAVMQAVGMSAGAAAGTRLALPTAGEHPDADINGTQVLFLGDDAWTTPGAPGAPGAPGGPFGDRYGYQRAQRRRRMWLASGLAAGTVVALVVIALVVNAMGHTSTTPSATQSQAAPASPAAATSAPPSPTASATTAPASTLTDGQSGLSYTQLAAPWQPTCPSGLNNSGFTWTAGESAVAGQVNGGQTTWYGIACSGPLPQQYGYNGVADLDNVATQLANQFNGTYYSGLNHSFQQQVSQPVQVSGHAGWEVKFLITYTDPQGQGLSWNDELGAVVVADSGSGGPPSVFYTSVPGNLGENNVDALVSSLQLAATPQASSQPTAASPPDDGSPAPGDGGNGGNGP